MTRTNKLRIYALLLALCMICGSLAGCDLIDALRSSPEQPHADDGKTFKAVEGADFAYSPYYSPVTSRYAYVQLNARQRELYDALLGVLLTVSPQCSSSLGNYPMKSVRFSGRLSVAQMRVTFRAVINDNPYYFWLSQSFSHLTHTDENYTEVVAYSEFSPEALRTMLSGTNAAISAFFAMVPEGLSAYEREKYVHDYLIDTCTYDDEIADSTQVDERNIRGHSIYGALVDHRCVCEGYGMTMQLLLNGLGVECVTLTGMSYNRGADESGEDAMLHLWNAVRLDGAWYHVDVTWDDQEQELRRYGYFNLDDAMIAQDHTISPPADEADEELIAEKGTENLNLFIPSCTHTDYNYYVYECPHLTGYDSDAIRYALLSAAQNREPIFTFYIDPARLDYDDAVHMLFREAPQYFFDYADWVNRRLEDCEIDDGNLIFYTNKERCAVSVELKYY